MLKIIKNIKNERAFTLIELIVSIAILSIVAVPISNIFLIAVKTNTKAKDKIIAANLAQNAMEAARENIIYTQNSEYFLDTSISNVTKYEIIENQTNLDSDYSAIISIDENSNEVRVYSLNNSRRSVQWTTPNTNIDLIITNTNIKNNEMIVSNLKESVRIRIEIYDQDENDVLTKKFRIKNETEDKITIHIVRMIKNDSINKNEVKIRAIEGKVKIVDNLYCRISHDNTFTTDNNQNSLLNIRTIVKKNNDIITKLETIKKLGR